MKRILAMAFVFCAAFAARALDTRAYVQSGLIAHWDGVENAGRGTHDAAATAWTDLVAGRSFALTGVTVEDDRICFAGSSKSYGELSQADTAATFDLVGAGGTVEIVLKANTTDNAVAVQSPTVVLSRYGSGSIVYCGGTKKPMLKWCWSADALNTVTLHYATGVADAASVNGSSIAFSGSDYWGTSTKTTIIGTRQSKGGYHFNGSIYAIRLYDRTLSADEIAYNARLDNVRFRQGNVYDNAIRITSDTTNPTGTVNPAYGFAKNLVEGQECVFTASGESALDGALPKKCTGWELVQTNGVVTTSTSENALRCAITYDASYDGAVLTWKWAKTDGAVPALRATGTQYVSTGVGGGANIRMVIKFRHTDTTTAGACGCLWDDGPTFCFVREFESKTDACAVNRERFKLVVNDSSANVVYTPYVEKNTNWHELDIGNASFKLDGVEIDKSGVSGSLTKGTSYSIHLFAYCHNRGSVENYMKGDIASCRIYNGDELVRDLVPWQKADGTLCLTNRAYDATSAHGAAYYTNGGKGSFAAAAGPVSDGITIVGDPITAATPTPGYGEQAGLEAGTTYTWTCPADYTNDAQTVAYRCTGWTPWCTNGTVYANEAGEETTCSFEYDDDLAGAVLTWKWSVRNKIELSVEGSGSLDKSTQWLDEDGAISLAVTPAAGWKFWKWTGSAVNSANRYLATPTVKMNTAKTFVANFYEVAKAAPTNVYVSVNGAGDLSGRDEENAARNLTSAYAACAANPVGGTVHVAGGIYRSTAWSSTKGNFTANAALTPAPYVTLVGSGDTNNPTILTGDRGLDDKWDYNGASQWSNGKLVLPPLGVATLPRAGSDDSNFISSSERAEGCRFENLTIHGFTSTAVSMSYATNAVFANCRFIGIGHTSAHPSLRSLTIGQAPVVVTNCLFVGHVSALGFSSDANVTMTIMDSLIRAGVNWGAYSAGSPPGIYNSANVTVKLVRTTVRDTQSGNPTMYAASGYWNCQDCSFINIYSTGGCTFYANGGGTFAGCAFLTNKVLTTATGYYTSACVGGNGGFSFSDCYFGGNKLTKTNGASDSDASVLSTEGFNTYTFVNCTAEDNCVTSTAGKAANACTVGGWRPQNFAIANCVFRNNTNIDATGTKGTEFRHIRTNADTGNSPMFVNSIVRNPAERFAAFPYTKDSDEHRRFGVAACDIQGYVAPTAGATGNGFSYAPIVDVEPCLAAAARHEGPRGARPPTRETPREVARGAVRVYKATNGYFYFLDTHVKPNQWRKIAIANDGGSKVSLADGLKIGLDPSKPAHPDVFGTRRRLRPAMGPADTPPIGAVLSVR